MMARTQITLDPETHRRARRRASELGTSLAEYVRRTLEADLAETGPTGDVQRVFSLGASGGSHVAARKDRYLAEALRADVDSKRDGA